MTTDWVGFGWSFPDTQFYDAMADGWSRDSFKISMDVTFEMVGVEAGLPPAIHRPQLTVFPNPVTGGYVSVTCGLPAAGTARLSVLDAAGRSILTRPVGSSATLDLRGLAPGAYHIRLEAGGQSVTQRLVVQH